MPRVKSTTRRNGKKERGPNATPVFMSQERRERCWGGDGTVVAPDSVRVSLPYEVVLEPATTLGSLYLYQFRGNSAFDPDLTGAGSQPTGFDQWSAFYNEYTVLSSHFEVEYICATSAGVEVVTYPSYNTTSPSTSFDASSRPYAKRCLLLNAGNGVKETLRSNMSTAQMLGVRDEAIIDDDAYGATISANPGSAAVWYWNVVAQNTTNTNTLADAVRIRLVYDVLFHDRVQLSLSSAVPRLRSGALPLAGPAGLEEANCSSLDARADLRQAFERFMGSMAHPAASSGKCGVGCQSGGCLQTP